MNQPRHAICTAFNRLGRVYTGALWLWVCLMAPAQAQPQDPASTAPSSQQVTLWIGSASKARKAHELEVVKLALQKSRDRYGPYQLHITESTLSRPRTVRIFAENDLAQVVTSTAKAYQLDQQESPLISIRIPLLHGLLGSRQAIVLKEHAEAFSRIKTFAQLRQQSAGLGFDWYEVDIFNAAGLPFTTGANIQQLLGMLAHRRFDYLPLGLLEASTALANIDHPERFAIVDDLIIHYPLKVYMQVSRYYPHLLERLTYGLTKAQQDGSLEALFNQHYGEIVNSTDGAHVIHLPSP